MIFCYNATNIILVQIKKGWQPFRRASRKPSGNFLAQWNRRAVYRNIYSTGRGGEIDRVLYEWLAIPFV